MNLVRIYWRDTHAEAGWVTPGDCDPEPRVIISVGFLLGAEKANHHTIAQDYDRATGMYGGVSHIYSPCVQRMETIE